MTTVHTIPPVQVGYNAQRRMTYHVPFLAGFNDYPAGVAHRLSRPGGMDAWELHLVARGRSIMTHGPQPLVTAEGEMLLFPPGSPHIYGPDPQTGWRQLYVYFFPKSAWVPLLNWPNPTGTPLRLPIDDRQTRRKLEETFEEMIAVSREPTPRRLDLAHNLLERLLLLCDLANPHTQGRPMDSRISATLRYLQGHLAERITIPELAARCRLSPSRFAGLFLHVVGTSPLRYLERLRIERAAELLLGTDLLISDIAATVGFDNPFYFTRLFHRAMAKSPREFRQGRDSGNSACANPAQASGESVFRSGS